MRVKVKKQVLSFLLCAALIGNIFPVNSVAAEKDVYALTYHVGAYDMFPESDGSISVMIDGKKYYYSDDFDDGEIATKISKMENQNVVYELHDSKITKVYTMDEVLSQEVTVEPSVKDGLIYRKGKFSQKSFELVVKVSNNLQGDFKKNDLLWSLSETEKDCLYSTLKKLEIKPSNEVDFGSSGWWMWKEYEKTISENVNDVIKAEETKEYKYTVNLHKDGVENQKEYNIILYATPTFDTGVGRRVEGKIPVGNLDYQEEKTEEKKATSNSGQSVAQAANKLDGIQNAIQFSKDLFSADQADQINEFVNIWMSELLLAKYVDKSDLKEKVSEKIANELLKKLGLDTSVLAIPGEIRATTYLETQTKDGSRVFIQFNIDLMNFDFGNSGMPTMATGSGTAIVYNMDGEELDSSVILPIYANVCAFCEQLQKVAKDTIFNGAKEYLGIFGISAESTAEAMSSQIMAKVLNNKYTKDAFKMIDSKDVKKALKKMIVTGEKTVNKKIFKLITTPSQGSTEISVKCPVDVKIYDNDGILCGLVKDNTVDSTYDDIFVNVVGDQKNIYLVGDDYSFEMTGTDDGSMDYVVREFDDEGNTTREITYENIKLSNRCKYYSYVPEAVNHSSTLFDLTDSKGSVIAPTKGSDEDSFIGNKDGKCGDDVYWELSEDGILRIWGNGKMSNFSVSSTSSSGEPGWRLYNNQITEIVVEEGVTSIGSAAFYDCSNLNSVRMPDSLMQIGSSSFRNCISLEQINLPKNLQELSKYAFVGTKWFMQQSNGILYLDHWLLGSKCGDDMASDYGEYKNETDIFKIEEGTIGIASSAMYDDSQGFKTVIFPKSMKYICSDSFFGTDDCCTYIFKGQPKIIADRSIVYTWNSNYKKGIVFLGKPGGSVEEYASKFGIRFISTDSYEYDKRFSVRVDDETGGLIIEGIVVDKNVEIPAQIYGMEVTCIGDHASSKSKSIETLILPDTVKKIKYGAFEECIKLKKVIIPDSVEMMGQYIFGGCDELEEVVLGSGLIEMGVYDGITSSWVGNFDDCRNLKKVTIKSTSLKEIPKDTFSGCSSLNSINLPDGLTSIEDHAFSSAGLRHIKLPQSLTSIGRFAFAHNKFRSVKIPEKVIDIGEYAFHSSDYSVTVIGKKGSAAEIYTKNFIDIDSYIAVEGISLNKETLNLKVEEKDTLIASVFPKNATLRQVIWSSDHPEVADVSNGTVIAKTVGTAIITAQADEQIVSCEVIVTNKIDTIESPKPNFSPIQKNLENPTREGLITTWDCVWFGNYWQEDTNGDGKADKNDKKTPIKWRVLSVNGDDVFLLANQNLDAQPYNDTYRSVTWETCTIRSFLNGYGADENDDGKNYSGIGFINESFTSAEQSAIKNTTVVNADNDSDTEDQIYLLSLEEVKNPVYGFVSGYNMNYDETRMAENTEYTKGQGAWESNSIRTVGNGDWWLRSHSFFERDTASAVHCNGHVVDRGFNVSTINNAVRPALHLTLSSASCWSYAGTISSDGTENEVVSTKPDPVVTSAPTATPDITPSVAPMVTPTKNPGADGTNTTNSPSKGMVLKDSKNKVSYKVVTQSKTVAFYKANNIKAAKIVIPATVTISGIKYKVTAISDNAFNGYKNLKSVNVGKYVTSIGNKAFFKCTSLKKITIPASVTKIGKKAFCGCKKLKSITIKTKKLKSKSVGTQAFKGIYKKAVIKVPKKQKKAYTKWLRKKGITKKIKIK